MKMMFITVRSTIFQVSSGQSQELSMPANYSHCRASRRPYANIVCISGEIQVFLLTASQMKGGGMLLLQLHRKFRKIPSRQSFQIHSW